MYLVIHLFTQIFTKTNKNHTYTLHKQKKKTPARRTHLTFIRIAIIKKITPPRPGTPRAPGVVARSWPGERARLGSGPLHSQPGLRWLPPRRVARRRLSPPTRRWPESTPPTFTGAPMERLSRSVPLRCSKKRWNLSRRRWELQMRALTPGSTKLLGQRNKESPTLCRCQKT